MKKQLRITPFLDINKIKIKKTERATLKTFQTHIPSIYFSNKNKNQYQKYVKNAEYIYRDLLNFPPKNVSRM